MAMTTALRFGIGLLIVAVLILGWAAMQGLGDAFGHGVREYLVR